MNLSALCLSLLLTPLGAPAPREDQDSSLKQIPILSIDLIIPTPLLTRNPQLIARTETEKMGFFTNKKVQVVAGTTDKLFCEGKTPRFFVESRDATGDFGLTNKVEHQLRYLAVATTHA